MNKYLLLVPLYPLYLVAKEYSLNCDAGRWEGNSLATTDNSSEIEKISNGISS